MKTQKRLLDLHGQFLRPVTAARNVLIVVLISLLAFFAFGPALQAQESVGLGTADDFAVLSGASITNTGPTTITGDVGIHPGTSVTGWGSVTLDGELHETDAVAEQAKVDLVTAYDNAAGQTVTSTIPTELGGQTLTTGVYDSSAGTFGITAEPLTLDAEGDPNAVFVFQMESTLDTASASSVNLINGAQACNVFWQVGSSATLGTNSSFVGNILTLTSITLTTGATVEGRVLARNGSVTLDSNTITRAVCTTSEGTTTTTSDDATTSTVAEDATPTTSEDATTSTVAEDATTTTSEDATTTTSEDATTTTSDNATTSTVAAPVGGVDTGGGSTSGAPNIVLVLGGFSLLAAGIGAFVVRRLLQDGQSG